MSATIVTVYRRTLPFRTRHDDRIIGIEIEMNIELNVLMMEERIEEEVLLCIFIES